MIRTIGMGIESRSLSLGNVGGIWRVDANVVPEIRDTKVTLETGIASSLPSRARACNQANCRYDIRVT